MACGMKTSIVSALNDIANGFAASYSNALQTMRGFTGKAQESTAVKPMVNTAISTEAARASASSDPIANELQASTIRIVA